LYKPSRSKGMKNSDENPRSELEEEWVLMVTE